MACSFRSILDIVQNLVPFHTHSLLVYVCAAVSNQARKLQAAVVGQDDTWIY